ncbi:MAG: PIG-L deacetylase family protein [Steroidobacteraceae bacterium]
MLRFSADFRPAATVLCLGAHCDDIEIGCAGALLELQERDPSLHFVWVVFSRDDQREAETRSACARLLGTGSRCQLEVHGFQGSYFPYVGPALKDCFESIKSRVEPDLIFTHFLQDRHQDHRVIAELTWNTFRNHAILEYEIPKYEGDLDSPNVYFPVSRSNVERKVDTLMTCFPSQLERAWFDADLFRGVMRLRGVECNSASRYAEAFHARKVML